MSLWKNNIQEMNLNKISLNYYISKIFNLWREATAISKKNSKNIQQIAGNLRIEKQKEAVILNIEY